MSAAFRVALLGVLVAAQSCASRKRVSAAARTQPGAVGCESASVSGGEVPCASLRSAGAQAAAETAASFLRTARERRVRLEALQRGAAAGSDFDALLRVVAEAKACADFAREAWSALFPPASAAAGAGRPWSDVVARIGPGGAEALYLEASCSAAEARAQGFLALVDRSEELRLSLERAAQLAPDLDGAGAERELGRLLASLPALAGGDLVAAGHRFEAALARAPNEPRNFVCFARTVAVKAQDRALFESLLRAALDAARDAEDAAASEARELLEQIDVLFAPEPALARL